jgi:hypothetical protein
MFLPPRSHHTVVQRTLFHRVFCDFQRVSRGAPFTLMQTEGPSPTAQAEADLVYRPIDPGKQRPNSFDNTHPEDARGGDRVRCRTK